MTEEQQQELKDSLLAGLRVNLKYLVIVGETDAVFMIEVALKAIDKMLDEGLLSGIEAALQIQRLRIAVHEYHPQLANLLPLVLV